MSSTKVLVHRATPDASVNMRLTHEEICLLIESCRIAGKEMREVAAQCERVMPKSPMVERLRVWAEDVMDLREKLDA